MAAQEEENLDDVISDLIDGDSDPHPDPNPNLDASKGAGNGSPFEGIDTTQNTIDGAPVQLTQRAADQVRKILKDQSDGDLYLRVAVEGGGCSGLSYKLGLDHITEEDQIIESQGLEVIVKSKHMMYLEGISIDYPDGLDARGFTFDNPNASETCGCGSSFAT